MDHRSSLTDGGDHVDVHKKPAVLLSGNSRNCRGEYRGDCASIGSGQGAGLGPGRTIWLWCRGARAVLHISVLSADLSLHLLRSWLLSGLLLRLPALAG